MLIVQHLRQRNFVDQAVGAFQIHNVKQERTRFYKQQMDSTGEVMTTPKYIYTSRASLNNNQKKKERGIRRKHNRAHKGHPQLEITAKKISFICILP